MILRPAGVFTEEIFREVSVTKSQTIFWARRLLEKEAWDKGLANACCHASQVCVGSLCRLSVREQFLSSLFMWTTSLFPLDAIVLC